MQSLRIREKFLEFMKKEGHEVISSSSLIPENDPTTLFTGSGMQPMLQYLLGEPYPTGASRIVDSQKCFRSQDINEVGNSRHTTFFEMLGNWSFGDYWKQEQLEWLFTFLVDEVGIDPKKLYVTVFAGDKKNNLSKDEEAATIWEKLFSEKGVGAKVVHIGLCEDGYKEGMQDGRIFYYDSDKNWWSRSGPPENMPVGEPGGGDSEIFYDFGTPHDKSYGKNCHLNCECGRFLEIGNSVFMEYKKVGDGKFEDLPKKNIDFGGGLERMAAARLDNPDIFLTEFFENSINILEETTGEAYKGDNKAPFRIISDHLRGATIMIAEGVEPSNKLQGYVLRRLIRRSAVKFHMLTGELNEDVFVKICRGYIDYFGDLYFDVSKDKERVEEVLREELKKFKKSLDRGLKEIEKVGEEEINGTFAFDLYQTYGFPIEITKEILEEKNIEISLEDFENARKEHQEKSKTVSGGAFKGGLGDSSKETVWFHTITHLLHQALRDVLGDHVYQAGSNITPERLRFDFTNDGALTDAEITKVEDIVNSKLKENLEVKMETMSLQDAQDAGALAFFKERYGAKVNVYLVGDYSTEICGGPHVDNTSEIKGKFKIIKEKSSGSGIRRIQAILE